MSAGIPIPASTISPAAARCSTWGPITSPTSSTFSVRWRASAASRRAREPSASSPASRSRERAFPVEVATHVTGTLMFASGAAVSMTMSFDVAAAQARSDRDSTARPARSSSPTRIISAARSSWRRRRRTGARSRRHGPYADGNYRILGLADMAQAIRSGRPHRASGELAFHVLEVMEAFQTSSDAGEAVTIVDPPGAAGAVAAVARASANSIEEQIRTEEMTCAKRSSSGAAGAAMSRSRARISSPRCSRRMTSRSISKTPPRRSPIRRSPT